MKPWMISSYDEYDYLNQLFLFFILKVV